MTKLSTGCLTEKGNLKSSVQKAIKAQALDSLIEDGYELKPNGKLSKVVGTIGDNIVSVNLEVTVGFNTSFTKKGKKGETKTEKPIEIPNLF